MPQKNTPLRVLHVPNCVGGHPQQLARAERELGLQSWAVAFFPSKFRYASDEYLWNESDGRWQKELKRWRLLWRALLDYDVVHFNFGQSLTPQFVPGGGGLRSLGVRLLELKDLPVLKAAGKRIVVTFQGDDARQGELFRRLGEADVLQELGPGYYSEAADRRKRWRIAHMARFADCIYAVNPDLLHLLPRAAKFLPYAHVDLRQWQVATTDVTRTPVVLHAPTHRGAKGTAHVLRAVDRLRAEGVPFEFRLIENLPQDEARALYETADLLVDQLLFGWYGGLAVELMALGKPVICFIRSADLRFIPRQMKADLPIINADPASIYAVLRQWLTVRRHELAALGRISRGYVEKWHDPLKIAAQTAEDYQRITRTREAAA